MEILEIYLEEQLLITYCVIKYLISLKIQNMTVIKKVLVQWCIIFDKEYRGSGIKDENMLDQQLSE